MLIKLQVIKLSMLTTKENAPVKRRSKGEQTRLQILHAAAEVLAKNGIKGATHRAIANHANIQLSLTTYYFKDIQELVRQAFILCSSQITAKISLAWQPAIDLLTSASKKDLRKVSEKENLRNKLATMGTLYIIEKIVNSPVELAVEQLLFTEMRVSPQLHLLANQHREILLTPFFRLCKFFNSKDPHIDADIMLTVFSQLEYRNLTIPVEQLNTEYIQAVVSKVIGNIMNLRR
jgi:DNA-binding transcriptional regulator YbjK